MLRKVLGKSVYIAFTAAVIFSAAAIPNRANAEVSVAWLSNTANEFSGVPADAVRKDFLVETQSSMPQENYLSADSTYLVYPEDSKKNSIINSLFKNKSLSVSIPLQYKKHDTDMLSSEAKKVIKHLEINAN